MPQSIEELITLFFSDLLGQEVSPTVVEEADQIQVDVQLDPNISGMVIGYKGEVLTSLQLILALMVQKQLGEWKPVRVNVNDYREQRVESLHNLASSAAERALAANKPVALTNLSSYERRIIHAFLAENNLVETHSEGENPYRKLIVSPKIAK